MLRFVTLCEKFRSFVRQYGTSHEVRAKDITHLETDKSCTIKGNRALEIERKWMARVPELSTSTISHENETETPPNYKSRQMSFCDVSSVN